MNMDGKRFIIAKGLIDGCGTAVRRDVCLVVEDGLITAIDSASRLSRPAGTAVDDFSHCMVLPALVDCSVQLARSPALDRRAQPAAGQASPAERMALIARHLDYCQAHGVLGVADGGGQDGVLRDALPEGEIAIRTGGPPGSDSGGDFLKVAYSDTIAGDGDRSAGLDFQALCRCLQHRAGRKAVVVANGPRQVAEAIEAGCDAVEQGYAMGEDNLRKMAERDILWIPSVLQARNGLDGAGSGGEVCCRFSLRYVSPGKVVPGGEAFWKKVLAEQLAQLRFARAIGVTTAVGTGAGSTGILHGESVAEEMKLFIKAGYSLTEAVRCASETGASFFGLDGLGSLEVGRPATFLLTRGTAQQLPRKLAYLEGIFIGGAPSAVYRKNPVKAGR